MTQQEVWKVIEEYPDYEVSNMGRLWSWKRNKYMKLTLVNRYVRVVLRNTNQTKSFPIHRLVANAFIPNPDNKPVVDHIDGDAMNNQVNNLRWATFQENSSNSKRHKPTITGVKGIILQKKLYRVRIMFNGKQNSVGYYKTLDEAIAVRTNKAKELYGEFFNPDEGKILLCH